MSRCFGLRQGDNWLPASVDVEGHTIPLLNFEQIEQLSARVLYTKARSIRDKLGADRLPPLVPGTISVLMKWLIHVQCHMLCPVLDRSTKVGNIDSTCMDACPSVACPCPIWPHRQTAHLILACTS
jgi:hypothetical protein